MSSHQAEQSIIGGLLVNSEKLSDVLELISSSDFHDPRHKMYFKAAEALVDQNEPVDLTTICAHLAEQGLVPDIKYLMEIAQSVPSAANIGSYARIVKDASTERSILSMANEIAMVVHNDGKTADKLEDINQIVSQLHNDDVGGVRDAGQIVRGLIDQWQERSTRDGSLIGYSTGFEAIDALTMGLQGPDLITIAAGSGKGKTTLAMNMAQAVAINQNKPVLVFSLEMSGEQIIDRLTASVGGIPLNLIKSGKVFGSSFEHAIVPAVNAIKGSNLHIDDRGGLSIGQIKATARKFFKKHGSGLLVVDYIGLVRAKAQNKEGVVAMVSGELKALAKELNIPVIALAQMNRNGVQRSDKRPVSSDLRDSAAIEHDSDILIMLHEDEENNAGVMEAHFIKHRNGETGTEYLVKNLAMNRFETMPVGYQPKEKEQASSFSY